MTGDTNENKAAARAELIQFDAMNLQVGSRLQFMVVRDVKPLQYFTTLIGYAKDEYVIVKVPMEHGAPILLHEGEKLTVRVFTCVKVCTFGAIVQRLFMHPYFYAHLSFPNAVSAVSLRMAMRVKVHLPVQVSRRDAGTAGVVTARISNVSMSGALLEAEQEIGKSDELVDLSFVIVIPPWGHEVPIKARAKIRNTGVRKPAAAEQADIHTCGVQFDGLDPNDQIALQNLTYEALLNDRQSLV
jgi:c-di-GMP-binding flagellar brake protein YcgR